MPEVADKAINDILARSLIVAETISASERADLLAILSSTRLGQQEILTRATQLIQQHGTIWSEHFLQTELATWLAGYDWMARKLPSWTETELSGLRASRFEPPPPPRFVMPGFFGGGSEEVRFPLIEHAAERLLERNILTRSEFDMATEFAKQRAFTVAGNLMADTINSMREILAENLYDGTSWRGFREAIEERLGGSPIGTAHLENVYRTNVQSAFRDGRETLLANPIVDSVFPYQAYIPIFDARARHFHRLLGTLGLNGTGIYRRDDPFWERFTPPWDYNCRCGANPMTLEQAAAAGVHEAQLWIESGHPPEQPEHRAQFIPFAPNSGFGSRGLVRLSVDASGHEHKGKGKGGGQFTSGSSSGAAPGIAGQQRGLFDADTSGQKKLFDFVPPAKHAKHEAPENRLFDDIKPVEHVESLPGQKDFLEPPKESFKSDSAAFGRARRSIEFERPIIGPSGAKLRSYEWRYFEQEEPDDKGELRKRKYSDWDESVPSEHTGRNIVHQFSIETPDGKHKLVSLESALVVMGYTKGSEGAAKFKTLSSAVKSRAKTQMDLDRKTAALSDLDAAITTAKSAVGKLPIPEITQGPGLDGEQGSFDAIFRIGDSWQRVYVPKSIDSTGFERRKAEQITDAKQSVVREWRARQIHTLLNPKAIENVSAAMGRKFGTDDVMYIASTLRDETQRIKKRLAKTDKAIAAATDSATKMATA